MKKFLNELGFSVSQIKKIESSTPVSHFTEKGYEKNIRNVIAFLVSYGFIESDVIKIIGSIPVVSCLACKNLDGKLRNLEKIGFTKSQIIKMVPRFPNIFSYTETRILSVIDNYLKLGFTEEQVLKNMTIVPSMFSYSKNHIDTVLYEFRKFGFTTNEALKVLNDCPVLFGLDIEKTKQKIRFLLDLNLKKVILKDGKKLMESYELMSARYRYLEALGIKITEKNGNYLFYSNQVFTKEFGINNIMVKGIYSGERKNERTF
jgi:hypothetical protein